MKLIIDPVTSNKLSIHSYEGRQVLKKYVSLYQTGGADGADSSKKWSWWASDNAVGYQRN